MSKSTKESLFVLRISRPETKLYSKSFCRQPGRTIFCISSKYFGRAATCHPQWLLWDLSTGKCIIQSHCSWLTLQCFKTRKRHIWEGPLLSPHQFCVVRGSIREFCRYFLSVTSEYRLTQFFILACLYIHSVDPRKTLWGRKTSPRSYTGETH